MTDSAAVLLRDGRVLAAAEEERFTRVKHYAGFPYRAIEFVLGSHGLTLGDVDHVAIAWDPFRLGHRFRYMTATLLRSPRLFAEKVRRAGAIWKGGDGTDSGWWSMFLARRKLKQRFSAAPRDVHFLDHHACHMASCFYASGFEEAGILIMDGAGEAACTTWGVGKGLSLQKVEEHLLPNSLGHYYSAVTGYLGFRMLDGEYKVMGLSPCGDPGGAGWIRDNYLRSAGPGRYTLETQVLDYHRALRGRFQGSFVRYFGPPREQVDEEVVDQRHRDVAASAQCVFEQVVLDLARQIRDRAHLKRLVIAGGCGLNSTANGKILQSGLFEEVYVPPVAHDAGSALGAAMLLHAQLTGTRPEPITHAQFGPSFSDEDVARALAAAPDVGAEKLDEEALIDRCAAVLANGGVIAWFQGAMEFGPRALGNRSFLADPRCDQTREVLNRKIKKREPFRPFAPSVKAENAGEYLDLHQPSPFMTLVVPVRREKLQVIPAVTHVDGTARPQTVERSVNPRYWKLLDRFESLTGVPVLLNTSFNIQEPIVCTPQDALATFVRSGVDALAIGGHWVSRRGAPLPRGVNHDHEDSCATNH